MLTTATSNEGHAMSPSPPHPSRRRRAAKAVLTAAVLTTPFLTALPAAAAPCKPGAGGGAGMSCSWTGGGGGSTGGNGSPGGDSGGSTGPVMPPDTEGLTDNQAVDQVPGQGGAPPAQAAPTTAELVQQAFSSVAFPVPVVHTSPKGKTYVRMHTSFWVDGFEVFETEPIGGAGQTVQGTATPVSVTWNLGEKELVCDDAGSKDGKSCQYTYERSSAGQPGGAYNLTATITWELQWTCDGTACDDDSGALPDQSMTSVPTPLVVGEIQTNTGS